MKKQHSILLIAALVILAGCKKFEHGTVESPATCELCSFAKGIEGTYRGEIDCIYTTDSVTMTVQQVFLNNNPYDDSTTMYFATTHTMDTQGSGTTYDTIQIRASDGIVWFPGAEQFNSNGTAGVNKDYWIRNDTINRKLLFQTPVGYHYSYKGFLLKQ